MTTSNVLMKEVRSHLNEGGAVFRKWAGIGKNDFYCNAFVSYCLAKTDNEDLYCEGRKEINCPHSMNWCIKNLAAIPIYIALEGDVTYFDWEPNGLPNHVGFVEERIDADKYHTIEGNTSGAIVARRERTDDQEQLTFRLHYTPTPFSADKKLEVDGLFGYNSIAVMQRWLGVEEDAILGQITVKALQKKLGVVADALWQTKTTKALQKLVGAEVDGLCGPDTVKAFQKYLNKHAFAEKVNNEVNIPKPAAKKKDPLQPWFDAMKTQYEWSKDQQYQWVTPTVKSSKKKGTCITFHSVAMQRLGLIPSGTYFYFYPKTKKITGKAAELIKNSDKFKLWYPNKTVYELWKAGEIKIGDMVGYGNPHYHSMVFMGFNSKGEPIFNTMGGGKRGLKVTYPYYAKRKVNMIVRIKKIA